LFSIASRFGSSVASLATINNLPDDGVIYVGWTLKIPTTTPASRTKPIAPRAVSPTYIVQSDDYLYQIAVRYGITVQAIPVANNLPNNWLIYSGQRLLIPNSDSVPNPIPVNTTSQRNSLDVRIANIPLYKQKQTLTCEEASVAMATRGAVSESRLVAAMPRSDNPFEGIRGRTNPSYYGGLTDYGSYAQAVQKGLETLGKQSKVLYGQSYADFRASVIQHLQDGYPVVWWHTWRDTYQKPVMVKTKDGTSVKLVPYEHVGTIVAANDRGITYHDPYDATTRSASWSEFRRVSAYFDNMALVVQ
jgi:LysM repeat protein